MDNPLIVTITRTGGFSVTPDQFSGNQCGRTERVDYTYEVEIDATDTKLIEPEMFVLDRMYIDQYFKQKYEQELCECSSCEVMTINAVNHFKHLFVGGGALHGNVDVRRIAVIIRGDDNGYIKSQWVK